MSVIENIINILKYKLNDFMKNDNNNDGHGLDHFIIVGDHAIKALEYENLSNHIKLQIILAAYLHDVDDPKKFPNSKNYKNATNLLNDIFTEVKFEELFPDINYNYYINVILNIIDLVSCSKNGDSEPPKRWMAIPRDCDRLEAIGDIGIKRCHDYALSINLPLHVSNTIRVESEAEIWKVATRERFDDYKSGKKSISMIDHYYDKLLHIGNPEYLKSQNPYILQEAAKRNNLMIKYVLDYWKEN